MVSSLARPQTGACARPRLPDVNPTARPSATPPHTARRRSDGDIPSPEGWTRRRQIDDVSPHAGGESRARRDVPTGEWVNIIDGFARGMLAVAPLEH